MRRQHDQLQEEYAQQEQQGSLSLLGIDKNLDKNAYDIQQNFINKTKEAADLLATKGVIDSGRRRQLSELKSLYNQQVVPLQNALTQRAQRAEEYRKLSMDKNNILGANPNNVALTDIVGDPKKLDYKFLSGAQMAKDVENVAKQYADRFDSKDIKNTGFHIGFNYIAKLKQGVDPALVLAAMANDPNVAKDPSAKQMFSELTGIVNSVTDRYGLKDITAGNENEYKRGWGIAASGLASAIGKVTPMQMHDDKAAENYQYNLNHPKTPPEDIYGETQLTPKFSTGYIASAQESLSKYDLSNLSNLRLEAKKQASQSGAENEYEKISIFDKYGKINTSQDKLSGHKKDQTDAFITYGLTDSDYRQINKTKSNFKLIADSYRKVHNIPKSTRDIDVLRMAKNDTELLSTINKASQHEILTFKNPGTAQVILDDIFGNSGSTAIAYDEGYSNNSNTGIDFESELKRSGFKNKDEAYRALNKLGILPKFDKTNGMSLIDLPNNVKSVDKEGNITYSSGTNQRRQIGVVSGEIQKSSSSAINKMKQYEMTGTGGKLPSAIIYAGNKQIGASFVYNLDNSISVYDSNGNPLNISTNGDNKISSESYKDLMIETVHTYSNLKHHQIGVDKDNRKYDQTR